MTDYHSEIGENRFFKSNSNISSSVCILQDLLQGSNYETCLEWEWNLTMLVRTETLEDLGFNNFASRLEAASQTHRYLGGVLSRGCGRGRPRKNGNQPLTL